MLGSLTVYRRLLNEKVFNRDAADSAGSNKSNPPKLPALGHAIAGTLAGTTGAFPRGDHDGMDPELTQDKFPSSPLL